MQKRQKNKLISSKQAYRKDIISILLFKLIALSILWACCFSQPMTKQLNPIRMAQHLTASYVTPHFEPALSPVQLIPLSQQQHVLQQD